MAATRNVHVDGRSSRSVAFRRLGSRTTIAGVSNSAR